MRFLKALAVLLALFAQAIERRRLAKKREKHDEKLRQIEVDPVDFANRHFNSVLRDAESSDLAKQTSTTKPNGDK